MQQLELSGFWKNVRNKKTILWIIIFYVSTDLIALALGVGYLLAVIGLHSVARLAIIYFGPARKKSFTWLGKGESFDSAPPPMTLWRITSITLRLIVSTGMLGSGIWIILQNTFCQQNLICLFVQNP